MTIKTTKIDDITIRYQELPNENKETIVFLHFGGSTLGVWNGVVPFFEEQYHVIAPDLRCHGFSEMAKENCHIDDMAEDIKKLLDDLQIKKAYIVGSSLGADVAIAFAANYPSRIKAIAIDGGLYDFDGPDSKDQLIEKEAIKKARKKLRERVLAQKQQIFDSPEAFIDYNKKQWEKHFPWSKIVQKAYEDQMKIADDGSITSCQTSETIWSYIEPLYGVRFSQYFKKIACPVLWLPDEKEVKDEIVQRNLKKYTANLPYHKIVTIEGSVHAYTCLLKPKEFANEVQKFINKIRKT
jgi:2-succinyl-6-hydroxy-2,4-cyclohexadiene-1-carboxylate synthase